MKYPDVKVSVDKTLKHGSALDIIGQVRTALRNAGVSYLECDKFFKDAISSDYQHALQVCREWVDYSSPETRIEAVSADLDAHLPHGGSVRRYN